MPCAGVVSFSPQETPGGSAHPVCRGQCSDNLLPCRSHPVRGRGSREAGLWPSTSGFQKKARSHLGVGGKGRVPRPSGNPRPPCLSSPAYFSHFGPAQPLALLLSPRDHCCWENPGILPSQPPWVNPGCFSEHSPLHTCTPDPEE